MSVCDYCVNVAYDEGVETYEEQATIMMTIGEEMPDHLCDTTEEPDAKIRCDCSCKSQRKKEIMVGPHPLVR